MYSFTILKSVPIAKFHCCKLQVKAAAPVSLKKQVSSATAKVTKDFLHPRGKADIIRGGHF